MSNPLVSVLVMMYRPGGIDITLAGMRDQTFKDFELIIVDNRYEKRHQAVLDMAKEYGVNVIHVPEHRRNGKWIVAAAAFNTAFALARGKYVIILHDFTYTPPGWIEKHIEAIQDYPKRYATGDHTNMDLPELTTDLSESMATDRTCTELEDVFSNGKLDELCIFKNGRFDASWLPMPIGPKQWQPGLSEHWQTGRRPEHGFITLINDSMHREFIWSLNGVDERFDFGRGPFDANLGFRIAAAGGETVWIDESKTSLLNPRFVMRTLPFGDYNGGIDSRWSYAELKSYSDTMTAEGRILADNPYNIRELARFLESWRDPQNLCVSQDIPDLAYWRRKVRPETPPFQVNVE